MGLLEGSELGALVGGVEGPVLGSALGLELGNDVGGFGGVGSGTSKHGSQLSKYVKKQRFPASEGEIAWHAFGTETEPLFASSSSTTYRVTRVAESPPQSAIYSTSEQSKSSCQMHVSVPTM